MLGLRGRFPDLASEDAGHDDFRRGFEAAAPRIYNLLN